MSKSAIRRRTRRQKLALLRRDGTRHLVRRLLAETLETRVLLTTVASVDPPANSYNAPASTDVAATFDQNINGATASVQTFAVNSQQGGPLLGGDATIAVDGPTVTLNPTSDFYPGELVQVTATSAIQSTSADPVVPHVWQFRTAVSGGSGQFLDSGQDLGVGANNTQTLGVALGDLDGDGDLDAFFANIAAGNGVYLNEGGVFTDSGQSLGSGGSNVALGDFDRDGDLDAFVVSGGANQVWQNDGNGVFAAGQDLGSGFSMDVALGDVDGDGDLDAFVSNGGYSNNANRVWLNSGGVLSDSGQMLGNHTSNGVDLGDVDGDGDLDAIVSNYTQNMRIWLNDGSGAFGDSGQTLPSNESNSVSLGDLDGDGDLDAFIVNNSNPDRVWVNDGSGTFTDSGQQLGSTESDSVSLGDVDGDGDLDAMIANYLQEGNRFLVNDGNGVFTDSGQVMGNRNSRNLALGDVDNDGDLDFVIANTNIFQTALSTNRVWLNQNLTPSVTLAADNSSIAEEAGTATITATLSAVHTAPVTVDLQLSGSATAVDDYTVSAAQIVIPAGSTTGSITVAAVQDAVDEPDETVIVDIAAITNGQEVGTQQVTITILDDDEPPVPDVTLSVDNAEIAEAGGVATFAVTLSEATTVTVSVDLAITGTAGASDYNASGLQIVVAPGATTGSITVTAVDDNEDESNETVIVDIAAVTGGNEAGEQQQTTTITDDDDPPKLTVTTLTPTASGFVAEFSTDLNTGALNLYDTQTSGLGPADVTLQGAATGAVAGSLVVDASLRQVTFIKSGDPLGPDTYTVTLRSDTNGFVDSGGQLLDGNDDGTEGDDYTSEFTVDAPAANAVTIGIPDFVRGPGQDVNLPADETGGIPVTISEGTNVRAVDLRIAYDPNLLTITGGTVGPDAPAGASVIANVSTPGLAILVFFSTTPLPAGVGNFINLQAAVPVNDPSGIYGMQQVLDVRDVIVSDGNDNEAPVVVDDAFHQVSFFSDVSGNGRVNAADASGVARYAALIDGGFAGSPNADPLVVGDISGNGRLNAADASLLAQFAALIDVPQIPPIPGGIVITGKPTLGPFSELGQLGNLIVIGDLRPATSTVGMADDLTPFRVVEEAFSAEDEPRPVLNDVAVDRAMTRRVVSATDEPDEEELVPALEEVLNELLSAVRG